MISFIDWRAIPTKVQLAKADLTTLPGDVERTITALDKKSKDLEKDAAGVSAKSKEKMLRELLNKFWNLNSDCPGTMLLYWLSRLLLVLHPRTGSWTGPVVPSGFLINYSRWWVVRTTSCIHVWYRLAIGRPLVSNSPLPYPLLLLFRHYHATCRLVPRPTYQRVFTSLPNQSPYPDLRCIVCCWSCYNMRTAYRERASRSWYYITVDPLPCAKDDGFGISDIVLDHAWGMKQPPSSWEQIYQS